MATETRDLTGLEAGLGITFINRRLLVQALVHRSYLNEHPAFSEPHNERLEFLGDAALEIVVTEHLFHQFPEKPEGELTNLRAALVNADMLAKVATELGLQQHLYLSRGEARDTNGKALRYILANAFEAVVGAIYLDQGIEGVRRFVTAKLLPELADVLERKLFHDPKSKFQEKAQEIIGVTPTYEVLAEWGPDHAKQFRIGVFLSGEQVAEGVGLSKQEAQVAAATAGLAAKGWS